LVEVGADDRIVRITGKGLSSSVPSVPRMFAGIHILSPKLLRDVPKGVASSIIDPYVAAIERGDAVLGYDLRGYWSDIGTAERYAQAEHDVRAGLIRLEDRRLTSGRSV
jgi:NDP-sugar pyrophosphorylase family protein